MAKSKALKPDALIFFDLCGAFLKASINDLKGRMNGEELDRDAILAIEVDCTVWDLSKDEQSAEALLVDANDLAKYALDIAPNGLNGLLAIHVPREFRRDDVIDYIDTCNAHHLAKLCRAAARCQPSQPTFLN